MNTPPANNSGDARTLGRQRLAERRRRLNRIRVRIATVAASLFIAAFSVIYVQGSLGSTGATTPSTTTTSNSASSSATQVNNSPTPVTTSQS
ncbi:MAG: hypothetical protein QOH62_670 [Solirubrobacteraceae bacterium]|jgi:hypothetical protein|nr:hypothetical protein [Solirubrobacteraceae bacterium]